MISSVSFCYNAPELHDLKLLAKIPPTRQGADDRKRSLCNQFADLQGKMHAVAKQALESKELSEKDKACVKCRYMDLDVRNGGFDTKMARVLCFKPSSAASLAMMTSGSSERMHGRAYPSMSS